MAVNVRNIPAGFSPVDTIAALLLEESGGCDLTDTLVLLPNRRACRELSDAFVRLNGMQPTILPRIQPLGDPDEDEFFFADSLPQAAELALAHAAPEEVICAVGSLYMAGAIRTYLRRENDENSGH